MTAGDPVRTLLAERGCPGHIVAEGLRGLVRRWEAVVRSVESEYTLGLDDYLNDLDIRALLGASLDVASPSEAATIAPQVRNADDRFHGATLPSRCLWGEGVQAAEGWTADREWWLFRRPKHTGEALQVELDAWGLS